MDWLLYRVAMMLVAGVQALPLRTAARVGRLGGEAAWWLDWVHRRVALDNLGRVWGGERSPAQLRALARENFRRIGENFACAVKTAALPDEALSEILEVEGAEKLLTRRVDGGTTSVLVAIGHFGNFELFAKVSRRVPGYELATTYRALRNPALNRVMQTLRERSGCRFFERRTEGDALKAAMHRGGIMLGLLSDQHGGRRGVWGPFLGRECSTTAAPAVLALRYRCPLYSAVCYRVGLARWRIEVGQEIPTLEGGRARAVEAITADIDRALEAAVRRDPANWFWVHKRWKPRGRALPEYPSNERTPNRDRERHPDD